MRYLKSIFEDYNPYKPNSKEWNTFEERESKKARLKEYLTEITDEYDIDVNKLDWNVQSAEQVTCGLAIPHRFEDGSDLSDFKKYKSMLDLIDRVVDTLLKEDIISDVSFDPEYFSTAMINRIYYFRINFII